jgi:hypothetical protein
VRLCLPFHHTIIRPLIDAAGPYPTYPINRMSESPVPFESVDIPAATAATGVATAAAADDDDDAALCCNLRTSCKHFATRDVLVIPCARPTCTKGMHLSCFTSKYKYVDFPKLKEHVQVVCTKSCYKTVASPTAITWRNDGPVGKEEEGCSERILLDWLMAEGNYAKFRGGPQTKGKTKRKVAAEIARIINDKGVRVPRHDKQVENKIQHIEKQFKAAHDWANTVTGAGLEVNDRGSFDDAMKQKCPQYFDLLDVMIERSSVKPKATNANLDSSVSEDDNDEDNEEDNEEDNDVGDVAIGVAVGSVVKLPRRSRQGSDNISALGSSSRKRRATSVSESFLDSNRSADQDLARLTKTRSEYYQKMAEKTDRESAALDARKGAEAAQAAADVAKAAADVLTAGAEAMAAKRKLFDDCMEFVERYDGKATKEEILQLFPIYADVIDMVLRLQSSDGAGKVHNV